MSRAIDTQIAEILSTADMADLYRKSVLYNTLVQHIALGALTWKEALATACVAHMSAVEAYARDLALRLPPVMVVQLEHNRAEELSVPTDAHMERWAKDTAAAKTQEEYSLEKKRVHEALGVRPLDTYSRGYVSSDTYTVTLTREQALALLKKLESHANTAT